MNTNKSDYIYHIVKGTLVIIDPVQGKLSVTNGVERVLSEIKLQQPNFVGHVIYRDSDGFYDEIVVNENFKFVRFKPLRKTSEADALISLNLN